MRFHARRTLVQALIASLLIHLVLLIPVGGWVALPLGLRSTAVLDAVLVPLERVKASAPAADVGERPMLERLPPPLSAKDEPARMRKSPASSSVLGAKKEPDAGVRPAALAASPVVEGLGFDEVAEYRLALAKAIKRFSNAPALVGEQGREGAVGIDLLGHVQSPVPELELVQSSGRKVLDEHALAVTTRAVKLAALPEGMRGKTFRLRMVVRYGGAEVE